MSLLKLICTTKLAFAEHLIPWVQEGVRIIRRALPHCERRWIAEWMIGLTLEYIPVIWPWLLHNY